MVGPPGTGKSMLAARFPGILPPLVRGRSAGSRRGRIRCRRQASMPRAGASGRSARRTTPRRRVALVGGGSLPRPGEISLAHHGVLFLDELPEFDRDVLEVLREPLESGRVAISRAARQAEFPARFQLVAAMNPCPCGHCGDRSGPLPLHARAHRALPRRACPGRCRPHRHQARGAARRARRSCVAPVAGESSSAIMATRVAARARARSSRARASPMRCSAPARSTATARTDREGDELLRHALARLLLSARAYHRVLRVARTIADLAGAQRDRRRAHRRGDPVPAARC